MSRVARGIARPALSQHLHCQTSSNTLAVGGCRAICCRPPRSLHQYSDQGSTEPLKIWGLPTVGTRPAGGLPPLNALKYYRCAKMPRAAPRCLSAGRSQGLSPWGIPGGCRTLILTIQGNIITVCGSMTRRPSAITLWPFSFLPMAATQMFPH